MCGLVDGFSKEKIIQKMHQIIPIIPATVNQYCQIVTTICILCFEGFWFWWTSFLSIFWWRCMNIIFVLTFLIWDDFYQDYIELSNYCETSGTLNILWYLNDQHFIIIYLCIRITLDWRSLFPVSHESYFEAIWHLFSFLIFKMITFGGQSLYSK